MSSYVLKDTQVYDIKAICGMGPVYQGLEVHHRDCTGLVLEFFTETTVPDNRDRTGRMYHVALNFMLAPVKEPDADDSKRFDNCRLFPEKVPGKAPGKLTFVMGEKLRQHRSFFAFRVKCEKKVQLGEMMQFLVEKSLHEFTFKKPIAESGSFRGCRDWAGQILEALNSYGFNTMELEESQKLGELALPTATSVYTILGLNLAAQNLRPLPIVRGQFNENYQRSGENLFAYVDNEEAIKNIATWVKDAKNEG